MSISLVSGVLVCSLHVHFKLFINFHQCRLINPLTPKNDQHIISPYNNSPESHLRLRE